MAGLKTRHQSLTLASVERLYSGTALPRIWRAAAGMSALVLALGAGGCSLSPQIDSIFASSPDHTGSISPPPGSKPDDDLPPAADLAYARAAAKEVLARNRKDSSQAWENPATGARGTVTPIASAYTQGDQTCHDFLASYVQGAAQAWMQGEACKPRKGAWEVRSMKAWKRS